MRMTLEGLEQNSVYYVQLRTKYLGRTSDWSQRFELLTDKDQVKPGPVINLAGTYNEGNLTLSWARPAANEDGSALEDLKDYVVTITPAPEDPEWPAYVVYTEAPKAIFTKEDNAGVFGRYRAGLKIVVQARDIVDNLSAPVEIVMDKPKPKPVTSLVWEPKDNAFTGSWDAPTENVDGTPFTDPDGYELRVIYIGPNGFENVVTKIIPSKTFTFSYEDNKAAFGGPDVPPRARGRLTLEVRARDSVGQLSESVSAIAQNSPPKKVGNVRPASIINAVKIEWDANDQEDSVRYYEVWVADNPTSLGVFGGRTTTNFYIYDTAAYDKDHYFYVYAVDDFSLTSQKSDLNLDVPDTDPRKQPKRPLNPFGVDVEPPVNPAGLRTEVDPTYDSSVQASSLNVFWDQVPGAKGYHVSYSLNVTPPVWEYMDIPDNDISPRTAITPLVSMKDYRVRVRSYDEFINVSTWSEVIATAPFSNVEVSIGDISSDIRVISGGVLRSENYDEVAKTGWRLMPSGLDIQSGSVNAAVMRTGELRSSVLTGTGTGEPGQPLWSLNLEGNLTVRSARVNGQLLVGDSGLAGDRIQIASYNVGAIGQNWWALKGNGTFVTRGAGANGGRLEVSSDGISGYDSTNTNRVVINNSGQFSFQSTNGGITFDDNGLRLFNGSTLTVELHRSGNASFRGHVEAGTGQVGGWSLSSNELRGGSMAMRSDLGQIFAGTGTNFISMRAGVGLWAGNEDPFGGLAPFQVYVDGRMRATRGSIAGFTINAANGLYSGDNSNRVTMAPGVGIWAGSNDASVAPVWMKTNGEFVASKARISGDVYARQFRSNQSLLGTGNFIEIGETGLNDQADEIRFFLGLSRTSIRNNSSRPGTMTISASQSIYGGAALYHFTGDGGGLQMGARLDMNNNSIVGVSTIYAAQSTATNLNMSSYAMDFRVHQMGGYSFSMHASQNDASQHGVITYGPTKLKFLNSSSTVQARNHNDSGYGYFAGFMTNVSSEQFKADIEDWDERAMPKINNTPVRKYRRVVHDSPDPAKRTLSDYSVIGPVLEEMPAELRLDPRGETYDIGAAIGLLWKGLQELDQRKVDKPLPTPVGPGS